MYKHNLFVCKQYTYLCTTRGLFFGIMENLLTTLIPSPRAKAGGFTIHRPRPPRRSQTLKIKFEQEIML